MSKLHRIVVPVVLAVTSFISFAGDADKRPVTPEILPDGTIMYAEIAPCAQWSKDFAKTSLAQVFGEPEVRQFLAGPFSQISSLIKKATPAGEPQKAPEGEQPKPTPVQNAVNSVLDVLGQFTPGPFVVAVRFSPEDAQAGRAPAVAVMLGVSPGNVDSAANLIPTLLDTLLKNFKVEAVAVSDYQNVKLISVKRTAANGKEVTAAVTVHKGHLILASDDSFCKQIIDGMAGTLPKKLAENETYRNTGLTGHEHLIAYLDINGLKAALGAMAKPLPDQPNQLDDFFVLSGLNKSIAVAWSLEMNGASFESRTAIFTTGEREGLLGMLDSQPVSVEGLKVCPKGAPLAAGFRIRNDRLMSFCRNIARAAQGQKGMDTLNNAVTKLNEDLHRNLEKDIPEIFGNEIVLTSLAGAETVTPIGTASQIAVSVSIQDAGKADELLGQILSHVAKADGRPAEEVLKEVEYDGAKIRYLSNRKIGGVIELSPSFVIYKNRLVAALDVPTLKRAMNVLKGADSLVTSEAFTAALKETGGRMGPAFSYVDWAYMYNTAFTLGTAALRMVAPADVLKEIGVNMNLMPQAETVSKHLFPALSVAQTTPSGVIMVSRSPLPSVEVLAPPLAAVSAVFSTFKPFLMAPEKK
jgi:hypothetical protein